jgi:hypothetical protein
MNKRIKIYFTIIIMLAVISGISAQKKGTSIISGTVIDSETKEPLIAASVYCAETTIGTTVQEKGDYSLAVPKPGNYELVVSMVGYQSEKRSMFIEGGKNYTFNFKLVPKPMNINPVEIEGESQSDWKKSLRIFTRKIMGSLESEDDCTIENKEYLDFKWLKDTLSAVSRQPIVVRNDYLGYKVIFEILRYKYNPVSSYQEYSINSRFVEMKPADKDEKERWESHRNDIFFGSPIHFLWSLKHDRLKEESFTIHFVNKPFVKKEDELQEIKEAADFKNAEQFMDETVYSFNGFIKVEYRNQISYAKMICPFFTLDSYGIADNHIPFSCQGFWSNYGLGNMLPRNYLPESLKKSL